MMQQINTRDLVDKDFELLGTLLSGYRFPTYLHYPNSHRFVNYLMGLFRDIHRSEAKTGIVAEAENGHLVGLASLERLAWDSEHFATEMAKIGHLLAIGSYQESVKVKDALLTCILQRCEAQQIGFLSCRINSEDFSGLHLLESNGFNLMDTIIVLSKDLQYEDAVAIGDKEGYRIREFKREDLTTLLSIGGELYSSSRFCADPKFDRKQVEGLQSKWIENSCTKDADASLVIEAGGKLGGFITCILEKEYTRLTGTKLGFIGLLGVLPQAQGRGCGIRLVNAALNWFKNQGADIVTVGTQSINYGALGVYQKAGFKVVASLCTLHKWFV